MTEVQKKLNDLFLILIFKIKDYWVDILNEVIVAFRVSKDLSDTSFIEKVTQRLLLTEVVEQMTKKYNVNFL